MANKRTSDELRYAVTKSGCWNYLMGLDHDGYGRWKIMRRGKLHYTAAHRHFYEKLISKIPYKKELDHLCRNRKCVNPEHLEIVTTAENGRRGLKTKLKKDQVLEIRNLRKAGWIMRKIANKFDVTRGCINSILRKQTWVDV